MINFQAQYVLRKSFIEKSVFVYLEKWRLEGRQMDKEWIEMYEGGDAS